MVVQVYAIVLTSLSHSSSNLSIFQSITMSEPAQRGWTLQLAPYNRYSWTLCILLSIGLTGYLALLTVSSSEALAFLPFYQRVISLPLCYPYHEPGIMTINYTNVPRSEYTSFTPQCSAKNDLLSGLINGTAAGSLHNRHILLLGDSVDRGLADFFATLPGAASLSAVNPLEMTDLRAKQALSRTYTFPAINLTISNFFFYGLDERGWWNNSIFQGPWVWQDRFDIMATSWKGRKPDLIVAQSGVWDLSSYQFPQETPSDHTDAYTLGLQPPFRSVWLDRAARYIERIRTTFPDSQLYWRTIHLAGAANHYHGAMVNGLNPMRVVEMRNLQVAVTARVGVPVIPLHKLVDYQDGVMTDDVHLSPMGCALYAEMVLSALDISGD